MPTASPLPLPKINAESSKKKKNLCPFKKETQILEEDYLNTAYAAGEYLNVRDMP